MHAILSGAVTVLVILVALLIVVALALVVTWAYLIIRELSLLVGVMFRKMFYQLSDCERQKTTFDDPTACARILACTGYDISGDRNLFDAMESRALPNERLVRAFGIDNAFTTTDNEYRKQFRFKAQNLLSKPSIDDWKNYARIAKQLVGHGLTSFNHSTSGIRLDQLVQSVSLKLVLHVIFNMDPLQLDTAAISQLTHSINSLWVESKTGNPLNAKGKNNLQSALRELFDTKHTPDALSRIFKPRHNPLNLILPAYETLWRVVLFGFLEVAFRPHSQPTWRKALSEYIQKPDKLTFQKTHPTNVDYPKGISDAEAAISAAHIVNESLRLYPPTKRVHRKFHMASKATPELVAADIEACHRDPTIWPDSLCFVPSRWCNVSKAQWDAFMPFGGGKFICPAKADFGPRMIGLLVGTLATQVSTEEWELKTSEGGLEAGMALESGREGYEWIMIFRKEG